MCSQISASQPFRKLGDQNQFEQELIFTPPTHRIPGGSNQLPENSAASDGNQTGEQPPFKDFSEATVPHGSSLLNSSLGPVNHAAPAKLVEGPRPTSSCVRGPCYS